MERLRRFTNSDWAGWAGAERLPSGEPLIHEWDTGDGKSMSVVVSGNGKKPRAAAVDVYRHDPVEGADQPWVRVEFPTEDEAVAFAEFICSRALSWESILALGHMYIDQHDQAAQREPDRGRRVRTPQGEGTVLSAVRPLKPMHTGLYVVQHDTGHIYVWQGTQLRFLTEEPVNGESIKSTDKVVYGTTDQRKDQAMKDQVDTLVSLAGDEAVIPGEALRLLGNVYVWDVFPDMTDGSLPAPPIAPSGFSGLHYRAALAGGMYAARFCDDDLGLSEYMLYRGDTVLARVTVRLD